MKSDSYYLDLLDELLAVSEGLLADEIEFIDNVASWLEGGLPWMPCDAEKIERIHTRRFK